jgi:hypothetical protein
MRTILFRASRLIKPAISAGFEVRILFRFVQRANGVV